MPPTASLAQLGSVPMIALPDVAPRALDALAAPWNRARTRRRARQHRDEVRRAFAEAGESPCVVIATPGLLHLLIPAVELARRCVPVVLVVNGLPRWEEIVLREALPEQPRIRLAPLPRTVLTHGDALDVLLRFAPDDFLLMDPDLFVFEPSLFAELKLQGEEIFVGSDGFLNRTADAWFPATWLLAVNRRLVRDLMERYEVGAGARRHTPPRLVEPLKAVGLGDHNYVKDYLPYYDTLNLLMAAALAEGRRFRRVDAAEGATYHVRGVTWRQHDSSLHYLYLRLLEAQGSRILAARYRRSWGEPGTAAVARNRAVEDWGVEAIARIDRVVDRLERALS